MGSTISVVRRGVWGQQEPPRVKRRCVRRNPTPTAGGGTSSGTGGGTSSGGGASNGGGSGSGNGGSNGSGSNGSGSNGSGSNGSGSNGSGSNGSGSNGSGNGSSSGSGSSGSNISTGGGTGNAKGSDSKSGDGKGSGDRDAGDSGDGSDNSGSPGSGTGSTPTGTLGSQASSTKKFFQAVPGSTGGANSTEPSSTSIPTDEFGWLLPDPTTLTPNSDGSDSSAGAVAGGGRPSTGIIIAIVGGVLAGLAVLLVLAWLGHRAWKRHEEKRTFTTKEISATPPLFMSESTAHRPPATAFTDSSTLISHERGLPKPPAYPFTPVHEADSSTAVHEMPSPMPETIGSRHELATPDIFEIPDFGNLDLDFTDHGGDGDDMGIRRPSSLL